MDYFSVRDYFDKQSAQSETILKFWYILKKLLWLFLPKWLLPILKMNI